MPWSYGQSSGLLSWGDAEFSGYAGHGEGKNNSAMEAVPFVGPLPRGLWRILGPPTDTTMHGPFVLQLLPEPGTETYGRNCFLIQGDSLEHPGEASQGCIVVPRTAREAVWASGDLLLEVTP